MTTPRIVGEQGVAIGQTGDVFFVVAGEPAQPKGEGPITLIWGPAKSRRQRRIPLNAHAASILSALLFEAVRIADPEAAEAVVASVKAAGGAS